MTKALILVSHGNFALELKKTAEMIMGPQEHVYAVCLLPEEGPETFQTKLKEVLDGLDDFVVFADLQGGTPCNAATRMLMDGARFPLYAGMNLPMVISFINAGYSGLEADYIQEAQSGMSKINDLLNLG